MRTTFTSSGIVRAKFAMGDLDNDILISLVEARPVLWDKTLDIFKDRNLTRDAWREVCCALKHDFEDLEQKDKNAFGKYILVCHIVFVLYSCSLNMAYGVKNNL